MYKVIESVNRNAGKWQDAPKIFSLFGEKGIGTWAGKKRRLRTQLHNVEDTGRGAQARKRKVLANIKYIVEY